jgi:hypothetical protein
MQKYITLNGGSRYAQLKLLGYYAQRVCTSRRLRRAASWALIAGLRARHGRPVRGPAPEPASVAAMRVYGWTRLGRLLSADQCAGMLAYLRQQEMFASRADGAGFTLDAVPEGIALGDYPLETVVNCPHVMELANHPAVLAMAGQYLGYTPVITLLSLRWSFPRSTADNEVQNFHRDSEPGSIKLLVYLTDVDDESGPHSYVEGSHRDRMPLRLQRYSDGEVERLHGGGTVITGPAGTALAIDGKGIHKGKPPVSRARLMLGIQYSLLPCLMYEYSPVHYRGPGRFDAYINRLMITGAPSPDASQAEAADMAPLAE